MNFGFCADPSLSPRHNASIHLASLPPWLYFSRPQHIAFHNLCTSSIQPLPRTKSLLGLGLNFCLRPQFTSHYSDVQFARFIRDCHTRMFFAGDDKPPPPRNQLFIRSDWRPDPLQLPPEFRIRCESFVSHASLIFRRKRSVSNLLPSQLATLTALRNDHNLVVLKTDKNLGPAVVERTTYIQHAIDEHLSDTGTYRQLSAAAATGRTAAIRRILQAFNSTYFHPSSNDRKFLERYLSTVTDEFSYFYLLAKIHKSPWRTRPIVSVSGSLLHGLGQWTDRQLQRICRHLPYMLPSSKVLVDRLRSLSFSPSTLFFTCDATSMYTNIDTTHALSEIGLYLRQSTFCATENINVTALIKALTILMTHNVFRFGDTYWVQLSGTAMGTPPAPMYATLYFAIHEARILHEFRELTFYGRYIDDGFGVWSPDPTLSTAANLQRFRLLQSKFDQFGKLRWTFSDLAMSVDFLDVTISLLPNGRIDTCLFEKALNLYLYLPPQSNHPPGVLKGLIFGTVRRIDTLTSDSSKRYVLARKLFQRLCVRGYTPTFLRPIFLQALAPPRISKRHGNPIFLHVPYHANDPPSSVIQQEFRRSMLEPPSDTPLPLMRNRQGARFQADRLIIAYHRSRNLGNFLAPRRLSEEGVAVSSFLNRDLPTSATL
jgi:hypothetical protein